MLVTIAVMLVFLLSVRVGDPSVHADTTPCAPTDSSTLATLDYVRAVASSSDPVPVEARAELGIPNVPESEVVVVTAEAVCTTALNAVNRDLQTPAQPRALNIIRAGTVYLVHELGERVGEYDLWFRYDDATFSELKERLGF